MKTILTVLSFLVLSLVVLQAQDAPATAWKGVVEEQKPLKDAIILGAQLTESSTGQVWEFQLLDPNFKGDRRVVQWSKGKLSADNAGRIKAFDREDLIPLSAANLAGPVAPMRTRVKQLLDDAKKKAASIRYTLSRKTGQDQPVWVVTCLGETDNRVAVMSFGSEGPQLLQVDLEPTDPKVKTVTTEAKSFGNEVEKTFKGVGADLEEFFTGKRSVDK